MVLAKGKQATMGFLRAPEKSASSEQIKTTAVTHFVSGLIQLKELHSESDPNSSIDFSFSIKGFHNASFRLTAGQRQHRSLTAWALIVNSAPNPEVSLVSRCRGGRRGPEGVMRSHGAAPLPVCLRRRNKDSLSAYATCHLLDGKSQDEA